MIPSMPRWIRPAHLTDAERAEIIRATPLTYRAHVTRMSNWNHGWKCAIYSPDGRQLAFALHYPRVIEAFRAAYAQLEQPETARWRDTDVEVVSA